MKLALCNEVLAPLPFEVQCRMAQALGYAGLEVAPYTVCEDPQTMTVQQAEALRQVAADHGLEISGLHWLLVKPAGLSITDPDPAVRARTVAFMRHLCELCAAMGGATWCMARRRSGVCLKGHHTSRPWRARPRPGPWLAKPPPPAA